MARLGIFGDSADGGRGLGAPSGGMSEFVSRDARAAGRAVRVLKWLVSGLAVLVGLLLAATVLVEAANDHGEVMPAVWQALAGLLITLVGVGFVWVVLMLPLWLIGAFLSKR